MDRQIYNFLLEVFVHVCANLLMNNQQFNLISVPQFIRNIFIYIAAQYTNNSVRKPYNLFFLQALIVALYFTGICFWDTCEILILKI